MKKLLFILLLGLGFSQTELETRLYTVSVTNLDFGEHRHYLLSDIIGESIGQAIITVLSVSSYDNSAILEITSGPSAKQIIYLHPNGPVYYPSGQVGGINFGGNHNSTPLIIDSVNSDIYEIGIKNSDDYAFYGGTYWSGDVHLSITAEFPIEDTGYIEDGFEFCVQTGANLLSFPCDNQIGVSESLPPGIENFITSIIGQGEATTYNPALGWVGSLAEFTPGSGYWFKSNSSLCFEYECVED